jgi:hypothetical protein
LCRKSGQSLAIKYSVVSDDSHDANKWPATNLVLDATIGAYDAAGLGNFWVGTDSVRINEKGTLFNV